MEGQGNVGTAPRMDYLIVKRVSRQDIIDNYFLLLDSFPRANIILSFSRPWVNEGILEHLSLLSLG